MNAEAQLRNSQARAKTDRYRAHPPLGVFYLTLHLGLELTHLMKATSIWKMDGIFERVP